MLMPPSKISLLTALAAVALAGAACDGLSETTVSEPLINCAAGTMRIEGSLDGTSVSISQTSATGSWAQTDGGDFASQNNTANFDPSLADVEVHCQNGIVVGASTNATGTIVMPSGGPYEGETFCAGQGTLVRSAADGELQWVFKHITGGSSCAVPVAGELRGCFQ